MAPTSSAALGWLIAAIVLLVIEAVTYQLVTLWFAGGAAMAMLSTLLGFGWRIQWAVFIVASFGLMLCFRPALIKSVKNTGKNRTNARGLIGEAAVVTEGIDNTAGTGQVKVRGQEWTARSENGEKIPEGTVVAVKEIQGVKLIVEVKEERERKEGQEKGK